MGFKFDPCAQFDQGSECEERLESNRIQVDPIELTTFEIYIYIYMGNALMKDISQHHMRDRGGGPHI